MNKIKTAVISQEPRKVNKNNISGSCKKLQYKKNKLNIIIQIFGVCLKSFIFTDHSNMTNILITVYFKQIYIKVTVYSEVQKSIEFFLFTYDD